MATFHKVKIKELPITIGDGNYSSKYPKAADFIEKGIPFISNKDIKQGQILKGDLRFISLKQHTELKKGHLKEGDVIISTRANIGDVAWVRKTFEDANINAQLVFLRTDEHILHNRYLYFLLSSSKYKMITESFSGGSAQSQLPIKDLMEIPLEFPNFKTQTRIASVLSAYDDLIENNEKRIKILEEMAQLLYTEWFVKFKFPGHEKAKTVESGIEYGMVPEGWVVKKLQEVGMAITGKTPPTGNLDNFNGDVLFIKTPDIHGNIFILDTEQTLSEAGSNLQLSKLLPKNTVFISCIGTLGVAGITSKPSQTNQQINAIILNDKTDYILFYFFAKDLKQQLIGLGSNGATMGNVNKGKFENIKILYPAEETRKAFFNATVDVFDEILSLQIRNKNLSKTRDLLIPQLVTGRRELK